MNLLHRIFCSRLLEENERLRIELEAYKENCEQLMGECERYIERIENVRTCKNKAWDKVVELEEKINGYKGKIKQLQNQLQKQLKTPQV